MKYPIRFLIVFGVFILSSCGGSSGNSPNPADEAERPPGSVQDDEENSNNEFPTLVFDYPEFENPADLNIQGDATINVSNGVDQSSVLRLTTSVGDFQTGTAYHINPVPLASFEVQFSFRITESNGFIDRADETGADGLALVFQTSGDVVGVSGGEIGYGGISPGVAIEFDTYQNSFDPDSNHIGVNVNGSVASNGNSIEVESRFDNEDLWYAWVEYRQPVIEISVAQSPEKPSDATYITNVDIPQVIGQDSGFIGFTSATGLAHSNHYVVNWSYRSD